MKKISILLAGVCLMAATAFQSCDNDSDYNYEINYPTAMVTVKPNSDNSSFFMQLDDSTTILPSNMKASPFGKKEVRALVNFVAAEASEHHGQAVRVNWIDSILTKATVRNFGEKNDSAYGNDPVEIVNSWETSAEDGYLTLRFRTKWLPGSTHMVNLVHRTDANTPYLLQLYHNANGNANNGTVADGLVAFRIGEPFNAPDKPIEITIQWKSYSGMKTTTFKYRPRKD